MRTATRRGAGEVGVRLVEPPGEPFLNVNRPEDLENAVASLKSPPG